MIVNALESGYQLATYDILVSTNDEARNMADSGAPSGTVVWSKAQTNGKGRHGNKWISPPGNLYTSILLRMDCDAKVVSQLAFLSALAVRDAIGKKNLQFKWPNDILSADSRKIGGILLEAKSDVSGNVDWVVVGVGVNVVSNPPESNVDRPATNLRKVGVNLEVDELLQAYLDSFAKWFDIWLKQGFAPIRESWMNNAAFIGEEVVIAWENEEILAKLQEINEDGELVILLPDGDEVSISSGELFLGSVDNATSD